MQTGRASRTALRVAIRRAAHQTADRPLVLDDPIAVRLIGPGFDRDMERAMHKVARDFRLFMAARRRWSHPVRSSRSRSRHLRLSQSVSVAAGL
jgi:O-methyltransferase involved in polyketide biosynthesis